MGLAAFNRARRFAVERAGQGAEAPAPEKPVDQGASAPVSIPEDWRDLPWIPKGDQIGIRAVASSVAEGPFKNKAEAIAAIEAHLAKAEAEGGNLDNPRGEPVEIPEAWEAMTDDEMVELALAIVGGDGPLVPAEGQTVAQKARAIIEAEVAERAA